MFLQIPNFLGFNGIGILPKLNAPGASCFVLGDQSEKFICENSLTYVPYFQGHYYFLFKNNDMKERTVHYFEDEDTMNTFLVSSFGKLPVVSHYLNVSVSKEWVPHMTPLITNINKKNDSKLKTTSDSVEVCFELLEEIMSSVT